MWLEQDLLTELCDLLIEWFASDLLMSGLTVSANVECRSMGRTNLSFSVVLDCANLLLEGLVPSLNATVGVAVSDWTFLRA